MVRAEEEAVDGAVEGVRDDPQEPTGGQGVEEHRAAADPRSNPLLRMESLHQASF